MIAGRPPSHSSRLCRTVCARRIASVHVLPWLRLLDLGFEKYINEIDVQQQSEPQMQKYMARIKAKLRPKTATDAAP